MDDAVPHAALAHGPVWLVDRISGRRYIRAGSAEVVGELLVLDGDASVPLADVHGYERVVADGEEVTFVWFDSGDFD